jgi:hypothetical protein
MDEIDELAADLLRRDRHAERTGQGVVIQREEPIILWLDATISSNAFSRES